MFFVGATGQLLTLILTVCLPFVFLMSGNLKANTQSTLSLTFSQNQSEVISSNVITVNHSYDCNTEIDEKNYKIQDPVPANPIFYYFVEKWKPIGLSSFGNKAPPVSFHFVC